MASFDRFSVLFVRYHECLPVRCWHYICALLWQAELKLNSLFCPDVELDGSPVALVTIPSCMLQPNNDISSQSIRYLRTSIIDHQLSLFPSALLLRTSVLSASLASLPAVNPTLQQLYRTMHSIWRAPPVPFVSIKKSTETIELAAFVQFKMLPRVPIFAQTDNSYNQIVTLISIFFFVSTVLCIHAPVYRV